MKNSKSNDELKKKISEEHTKKIISIKSAYLSGSTFLLTAPFAISNITDKNIDTVLVTLLETGLLTVSIMGIKKAINSSKKIELMKCDITNDKYITNLDNISTCYEVLKDDIVEIIKEEKNPKQQKKLLKLRKKVNNMEQYYYNKDNLKY